MNFLRWATVALLAGGVIGVLRVTGVARSTATLMRILFGIALVGAVIFFALFQISVLLLVEDSVKG